MDFQLINNEKVYKIVIGQFEDMILSGNLQKGDQIPNERELSESLGVSRSSIREALSAMNMMGIVESKRGKGSFITNNVADNLSQPLSLIIALEENYEDFIETRKVLEKECARLAAKRRSSKELNKMAEQLKIMNKSQSKTEANRADQKYHLLIGEATGNEMLKSILKATSSAIMRFIVDMSEKLMDEKEYAKTIDKHHEAIYQHIKNQEPEQAHKAMEEHLDYIKNELQARNYI